MGNAGVRSAATSKEAQQLFKKFDDTELSLLDGLFTDLAKRSPDKTMSKATFLSYFNLPGILGERLFQVFDVKKTGVIDFEEFVMGLASYTKGSIEEKMTFLFKMYDLDGKKEVNPNELSTMLYSLVTPTTTLFCDPEMLLSDNGTENGLIRLDDDNLTHAAEMTRTLVSKIVDDALKSCDTNHSGTLDIEQFTNWLTQNPQVIEGLEEVLVQHTWGGPQFQKQTSIVSGTTVMSPDTSPFVRRMASADSLNSAPQSTIRSNDWTMGSPSLGRRTGSVQDMYKEMQAVQDCKNCNIVVAYNSYPRNRTEETNYYRIDFLHTTTGDIIAKPSYCFNCGQQLQSMDTETAISDVGFGILVS